MHSEQPSRQQQLWLALAVWAVCLPLWRFLPLWAAIVTSGAIVARFWLLHRGRAAPGQGLMAVFAALLAGGVILQFGVPVGVDPLTTLLTGAAGLKFLELKRFRDAQLLVLLCYFTAGMQLVFDQNIGSFALTMLSLMFVIAAQNMLERGSDFQYAWRQFSWRPLRRAFVVTLISVPLALVLFLVAPRLPSITLLPVPSEQSRTGISDSMDPGSISSLSLSGDVAFRVNFEGATPPASELYWRGLVMSRFDGRTWSASSGRMDAQLRGSVIWSEETPPIDWRHEIQRFGDPIRYRIYMEPSFRHWLFALPAAQTNRPNVGITRNNLMVYRTPIAQPLSLDVETWASYRHQAAGLTQDLLRENLSYPEGTNPQTEALVASWLAEGPPEEVLTRMVSLFNREFSYTLSPPTYPGAAVDQFLFEGRAGFCEHFASAAALILRIAGIPARVVAGYQGGEVHPAQGYLMVHQYNAHAWVEFWLPGQGWTKFDPTAAVAPERIERGFQEYFRTSGEMLTNPLMLAYWRDVAVLNWFRLQMDAMNYRWLNWVLSYDSERQFAFLQGLLGQVSPVRVALLLVAAMLVPLGFYAAFNWWRRWRSQSKWQRILGLWVGMATDGDGGKQRGITLRQVGQILAARRPDLKEPIEQVTADLEVRLYRDGGGVSRELAASVRSLARAISPGRRPRAGHRQTH